MFVESENRESSLPLYHPRPDDPKEGWRNTGEQRRWREGSDLGESWGYYWWSSLSSKLVFLMQ